MAAVESKENVLSVAVLKQHEMLAEVPNEELQGVVDTLRNKFVTTVSRVRGLSEDRLEKWLGDPLGPLVYAAFRPSQGVCPCL
jgi:hypothetical protein